MNNHKVFSPVLNSTTAGFIFLCRHDVRSFVNFNMYETFGKKQLSMTSVRQSNCKVASSNYDVHIMRV